MKEKFILISGGAGFIGSIVNKELNQRGFKTLVVDNLSRGDARTVHSGVFIRGDLSDSSFLESLFRSYPIEAVMHFAAHIDVAESVKNPSKYYFNNVTATLYLLQAMMLNGVKKIVFSSSAAVYGECESCGLKEEDPCQPINPYGESKYMVEKMLQDFDRAYDLRFVSLRYFNAAGGDVEGKIKNYQSQPIHLIPKLLRSLEDPLHPLVIYGSDYPTQDGTCIRDYVHVEDLSFAHFKALERLLSLGPSLCCNLGSGKGYSVKEVLHAAKKVLKKEVLFKEGERRTGDPSILLADISRAKKELAWEPRYGLEEMIRDAKLSSLWV